MSASLTSTQIVSRGVTVAQRATAPSKSTAGPSRLTICAAQSTAPAYWNVFGSARATWSRVFTKSAGFVAAPATTPATTPQGHAGRPRASAASLAAS